MLIKNMLKIRIMVLLCFLGLSLSNQMHNFFMKSLQGKPLKDQFKIWWYVFQKPYDINSTEALSRYKNFKKNVRYIEETNNKQLGYTLGLGPFADLSFEEFKIKFVGDLDLNDKGDFLNHMKDDIMTNDTKADKKNSYDWTSHLAPPKLAECGAISFATVATIEGAYHKMFGIMTDGSEQQLIDCTAFPCTGGLFEYSFAHVEKKGLLKEEEYPYINKKEECHLASKIRDPCLVKVPFVKILSGLACEKFKYDCNESRLFEILDNSPYGSKIEVTPALQHYSTGILKEECRDPNLAVAVVFINEDYVKFRLSFGTKFGENGYARVARGKRGFTNSCGLEDYAYFPSKLYKTKEY